MLLKKGAFFPQPLGLFCRFDYSALSNKRTVWNNCAGYYIELFGYYIKNYFLINNFFLIKSQKQIIVHARLFESAEYIHIYKIFFIKFGVPS